MASFGPAHIQRISPFFMLKVLWTGENKRPAQWSASLLAGWIEGPLSCLFMSTPLQKHTYKSHPILPVAPVIRGWWQAEEGRPQESRGASLSSFYTFQLMDFNSVSPHLYYQIHGFVFMSFVTLHKSNFGTSFENCIKWLIEQMLSRT